MPNVKAVQACGSAPAGAAPGATSIRRFLRLREVEAATGLRKTTIYQRISKGEFPAPVPLGEAPNSPVGWLEDEIAGWQATRIGKRLSSRTPTKGQSPA
jgi:prophage regulatory protein